MKNKMFIPFVLLAAIATGAGAQNTPPNPPAPGFGPMFGRDMENLALGTVLTHEVKVVSGKALFTDRLIPVFSAEGKEYELRLPMLAFSGVNLKQGDALEIQGIFTTLKTPDGKLIYSVKPQIVKVGGKEINLNQWKNDLKDRNSNRWTGKSNQPRAGNNSRPGTQRGTTNGMGPMNQRK